ncbi:putative serine/threonine protein phosphatase 2A 57 kDa regulatory subunit B' beta isoform-like [Capsicum annuum]|uniref:stemmadenine O-acetyltransferase-like n=1 Tax=Capsicum annuum TaxID=4072 RepID=UPI0007BED4A5|nr:stemmadenine O-acetyltransferase-like [Capsicum annuum]KAF3621233.1 putative serine/threonine protein phosphatase 2A 57 kDa regulatory subunit B' beta isoform-like [Capsicum annuum]KAF3685889.1 putative serine/threonine protein phosphatase 2A 57 kDa regulatory subunit B' beta isoform-like [Capsicum annuum]
MEIIILSKEIVKPSKPTPPNLRNHKLGIIEQLVFELCISPIFFYKNNNPLSEINNTNIADSRLRNSLSETLTLFHPLAGELSSEDPTSVDCNDKGVLYVEARVKGVSLDEFLQNPNLSQLINFLPQNGSMGSKMNYVQTLETLVSLQVTRFDCGGMAIGGVLFHKLLDGSTMSKFFKTWAQIARGDDGGVEKTAPLDFTSASLQFPTQNLPQTFLKKWNMLFFNEGKSLVRRFVFDARAIESIKTKVSSENVPHPTRVEALTTFIWKHMALATRRVKGISSTPSMVTHIVNLRSRIEPQCLNAFGNLIFIAMSDVIEMTKLDLPHLVGLVRKMFENMNGENLKVLGGDNAIDFLVDIATQVGKLLPNNLDTYKFTSWCNLGLYDVDFGWGKPIFVAPFIDTIGSLNNKQQIILVENGKNDGIEAWILRNNEEMFELENDEEFLAFASPNPSVHAY